MTGLVQTRQGSEHTGWDSWVAKHKLQHWPSPNTERAHVAFIIRRARPCQEIRIVHMRRRKSNKRAQPESLKTGRIPSLMTVTYIAARNIWNPNSKRKIYYSGNIFTIHTARN